MYSTQHKKILLDVALQSITYGLNHSAPLPVDIGDFESELTQTRATFVTLTKKDELRGCIGMLEAIRPLITDVADNAFSAAFRDGRFPPVIKEEINDLTISISVLSPSEPVSFISEEDLIKKIRPGIDGLILEEGYHRGTFLPSVWEQVKDTKEFLDHLKRKAGLPMNYWSSIIKVKRYTTEYIQDKD